MNDDGVIWKALADPTRRELLDLLRDHPRTTGELAAEFPTSRFAVMKHLAVLEEAGLVVVRRRGRERWNHLNAVPLRQAYERWMAPYAEQWAAGLLRLKDLAEGGDVTVMESELSSLDIAHEVRIEAPPERVFDALARMGEWWPHRFRSESQVVLEPAVGGRFYEDWGQGDGALYGVVSALRRPSHLAVSGPMGMSGPVTSVFTFDLEPLPGGGTVLKGTHRAYGDISEETRAGYTEGWGDVTAALVAFLAG